MLELLNLHPDRVFSRREAVDFGYRDQELTAGVRDGVLVRIRQGAYTSSEIWSKAFPEQRHQMRAHAVMRAHTVPLALSHTSAAVEHKLRLYRPELGQVHVTCLGRPLARATRDLIYHEGPVLDRDLREVNGFLAIEPVRAGLEAAMLADIPSGLVVLDSVIDLGHGDLDAVHRAFERVRGWPRTRKLNVTVRLVRTGSNSAGESLFRYLGWQEHLPAPVLQFEVRDEMGVVIAHTDFAWPEYGVLGEFDGKSKYGRLLKPGETPEQAVIREKIREDRIRELTQWLMIRFIWDDLRQPRRTAERLLRQLERGLALVSR